MATNTPLPKITVFQLRAAGNAADDQVIPFVEYTASVDNVDIATYFPLPYATPHHAADAGNVDELHEAPLLEYAALVVGEPETPATATNLSP
jgi:hypothetical protein